MLTKIKIFFINLFWSKEKKADAIIDKAKELLTELDKIEGIELALSFTAQIILMTEKTEEVICILEIQDAGLSVDIITNSMLTTPLVGSTMSKRVKRMFKGKIRETGIELAYCPDVPLMLVGPAAADYLGKTTPKKPKLQVIKPEDLN